MDNIILPDSYVPHHLTPLEVELGIKVAAAARRLDALPSPAAIIADFEAQWHYEVGKNFAIVHSCCRPEKRKVIEQYNLAVTEAERGMAAFYHALREEQYAGDDFYAGRVIERTQKDYVDLTYVPTVSDVYCAKHQKYCEAHKYGRYLKKEADMKAAAERSEGRRRGCRDDPYNSALFYTIVCSISVYLLRLKDTNAHRKKQTFVANIFICLF